MELSHCRNGTSSTRTEKHRGPDGGSLTVGRPTEHHPAKVFAQLSFHRNGRSVNDESRSGNNRTTVHVRFSARIRFIFAVAFRCQWKHTNVQYLCTCTSDSNLKLEMENEWNHWIRFQSSEFDRQPIQVLQHNYATGEKKPSQAEIKSRVLNVIRRFDKVTADKVLIYIQIVSFESKCREAVSCNQYHIRWRKHPLETTRKSRR